MQLKIFLTVADFVTQLMDPKRIIGPIFVNETINAERQRTHISEPFVSQLNETELEQKLFKQDGATAHNTRTSLKFLKSIFTNRIISSGICPTRSLDLTLLDYFL